MTVQMKPNTFRLFLMYLSIKFKYYYYYLSIILTYHPLMHNQLFHLWASLLLLHKDWKTNLDPTSVNVAILCSGPLEIMHHASLQ